MRWPTTTSAVDQRRSVQLDQDASADDAGGDGRLSVRPRGQGRDFTDDGALSRRSGPFPALRREVVCEVGQGCVLRIRRAGARPHTRAFARRVALGDAQKLMTRLGEGHGLRLFPFPRAFPVIASVATPEPRRRRPQANVTPIPNRCQLEPIASPCRFEHFQALARSTRGNRASRPIGRGRRRRPRVSSRRPFQ